MTTRIIPGSLAYAQSLNRHERAIDADQLERAGERPDWMEPGDQRQEHEDYVAGCASDHQNAFALSQMQHDSGWRHVKALTDAGRFVVAYSGPAYCRSTDAVIGSHYAVVSDHATRDEANAACGALISETDGHDDGGYDVHPLPAPTPPPCDGWDDDIPF